MLAALACQRKANPNPNPNPNPSPKRIPLLSPEFITLLRVLALISSRISNLAHRNQVQIPYTPELTLTVTLTRALTLTLALPTAASLLSCFNQA